MRGLQWNAVIKQKSTTTTLYFPFFSISCNQSVGEQKNNEIGNVNGALSVTLAMRSQLTVVRLQCPISGEAAWRFQSELADPRIDQPERCGLTNPNRFHPPWWRSQGAQFFSAAVCYSLIRAACHRFSFFKHFDSFPFLLAAYCDVTTT